MAPSDDLVTIELHAAGYRYPTGAASAVEGVDLAVRAGEVVLLTGPTGCGKSTLLRLLAGLLQRHGKGQVLGSLRVVGRDPATWAPRERVRALGLVGQVPGDQLVTGTVGDELAFGMESAGMEPQAMDARLPGLLAEVELDVALDRGVRELSGGQTQRLMVAAAGAAGAQVLLLDEPLAQLDPVGARRLLERLAARAREGATVLIVEHRLEAVLAVAHRVVVMEEGRVVADRPVAELSPGSELLALFRRLGLTVPGPLDLADRVAPRTLDELGGADVSGEDSALAAPPGELLVARHKLSFRWPGAVVPALEGVSLELRTGERVALVGGNGAGKSTLLASLAGQLPGQRDAVPPGTLAVPQDPDLCLFETTVWRELAAGPREHGLRGAALEERVMAAARALSIEDLLERAPQALSRGQRLRTAVAAALACAPRLLLLDEPTSGQDHDQVDLMMAALEGPAGPAALVFATHDLQLALHRATRVVVLHRGELVADGAPAEVLGALPPELPLELPPLARLCLERGWPLVAAPELARRLR